MVHHGNSFVHVWPPPQPGSERSRSLTCWATILLLLLAITAGAIAAQSQNVPTVQAGGCNLGIDCPPNGTDLTRSSSVIVTHGRPGLSGLEPVQLDFSESLLVKASYRLQDGSAPSCDCDVRTAQVTVDVEWTGTGWTAVCNGCGGGNPIVDIAICGVDGCGEINEIDYSWSYELVVNLITNHGFLCGIVAHFGTLIAVDYETTQVDDGDTIRTGNCTLITAVTPTSQTFTATDNGPFECVFSCEDTTGTSMTITYQ